MRMREMGNLTRVMGGGQRHALTFLRGGGGQGEEGAPPPVAHHDGRHGEQEEEEGSPSPFSSLTTQSRHSWGALLTEAAPA